MQRTKAKCGQQHKRENLLQKENSEHNNALGVRKSDKPNATEHKQKKNKKQQQQTKTATTKKAYFTKIAF